MPGPGEQPDGTLAQKGFPSAPRLAFCEPRIPERYEVPLCLEPVEYCGSQNCITHAFLTTASTARFDRRKEMHDAI